MAQDLTFKPYTGPAGGWGSVRSVSEILWRARARHPETLLHQNKAGGYACTSCAWAKPARAHPFEFCENGAKAAAWSGLTSKRVDTAFFAQHTLSSLETWSDHDLEAQGRLTHPLRWDRATDTYVPVTWAQAFEHIGTLLKRTAPEAAIFYTSGRASLESAYMYQLFARLYGTNHLPDSSNLCHETSSVGLPQSIGVTVGTVWLDDFKKTDCVFYFGQNVGTSSPRLLHELQAIANRNVPIMTFNLLRERGLEWFTNPQAPHEMLSGARTQISSHYFQVRNGGDIAALFGIAKALIAMDDAARAGGLPPVLDHEFIATHTHGFEAFATAARHHTWATLEDDSGLTRAQMEEAAAVYSQAQRVIAAYGMGLTQHCAGMDNVAMLCNLLLLRGNIGREGAGICAIRGHSNVQGQRTVGITEKPELMPNDRLGAQFGFSPPLQKGYNAVETCEAMLRGEVQAFVALGGNFIRAVPETAAMEAAWRRLPVSVNIATKLNRSHVIHGAIAYLLPCLDRMEIDIQATGSQVVSVEDSLAHIHASRGRVHPISVDLLSEPKIIAELAKATLLPNPHLDWDAWAGDYSQVRRAIATTFPEIFKDYETAMLQPGGFARPLAARERRWNTPNGKANFLVPADTFGGWRVDPVKHPDVLQLATLRSNDQFNTTIYGYHDRFRGVEGTRMIVFMNAADMARLHVEQGDMIALETAVDDGVTRRVAGLRALRYNIPKGCCAAYFPECNPLIPLWLHARGSKVPAFKATPVRVIR